MEDRNSDVRFTKSNSKHPEGVLERGCFFLVKKKNRDKGNRHWKNNNGFRRGGKSGGNQENPTVHRKLGALAHAEKKKNQLFSGSQGHSSSVESGQSRKNKQKGEILPGNS